MLHQKQVLHQKAVLLENLYQDLTVGKLVLLQV
jgi:hypothetical protein